MHSTYNINIVINVTVRTVSCHQSTCNVIIIIIITIIINTNTVSTVCRHQNTCNVITL